MLLGRPHSATVSDPIYPFRRPGMISLLERGDGGDRRLYGCDPSWNSTLYHMRHVWPSNREKQSVLHGIVLYVSKACEPGRWAPTQICLSGTLLAVGEHAASAQSASQRILSIKILLTEMSASPIHQPPTAISALHATSRG
jgi:hypothetical protein